MHTSTIMDQRVEGCVVGALVAEAAGTPLHWIYDPPTLKKIISQYEQPEFIPKSHSPFYRIDVGRNGCVGEQATVLMESLLHCKGFNVEDFKRRMYAKFGPDSDYETEDPVPKDKMPIDGPWRPGHIKAFIANFEDNEEVTGSKEVANGDAHGKIVPIVALYAGKPEMTQHVEAVTRVTHNNTASVQCSIAIARVIEDILLNGWTESNTPEMVLRKISDQSPDAMKTAIAGALAAKDMTHWDAVQKFQSNCGLPQSLQTGLHAVLSTEVHSDFAASIRPTLTACGDSMPRLMVAGACAGARVGLDNIPEEWLRATLNANNIVQQAKQLAQLRKQL